MAMRRAVVCCWQVSHLLSGRQTARLACVAWAEAGVPCLVSYAGTPVVVVPWQHSRASWFEHGVQRLMQLACIGVRLSGSRFPAALQWRAYRPGTGVMAQLAVPASLCLSAHAAYQLPAIQADVPSLVCLSQHAGVLAAYMLDKQLPASPRLELCTASVHLVTVIFWALYRLERAGGFRGGWWW